MVSVLCFAEFIVNNLAVLLFSKCVLLGEINGRVLGCRKLTWYQSNVCCTAEPLAEILRAEYAKSHTIRLPADKEQPHRRNEPTKEGLAVG
jgi:hypothetical protein